MGLLELWHTRPGTRVTAPCISFQYNNGGEVSAEGLGGRETSQARTDHNRRGISISVIWTMSSSDSA